MVSCPNLMTSGEISLVAWLVLTTPIVTLESLALILVSFSLSCYSLPMAEAGIDVFCVPEAQFLYWQSQYHHVIDISL